MPFWPPKEAHVFPTPARLPGRPTLAETFLKSGNELGALLLHSAAMEDVTEYEFILSRYDEGLWYADKQLGSLLAYLERTGLARDTLVIVMSDHGESFGEFDVHLHHTGPADANIHLPLIMRLPGEIPQGKREQRFAQTVDVSATILDVAGVPIPESLQGRPLLRPFTEQPFVVSAEAFIEATWILRTKEWKVVRAAINPNTGQPRPDRFGRPRTVPTLHSVNGLANESTNLRDAHPEIAARLEGELESWLATRLGARPDPLGVLGPGMPPNDALRFYENHKTDRLAKIEFLSRPLGQV
jgi:arylsulfatase A-like enzyme